MVDVAVGDRVNVPMGLDVLVGEVVDSYDTGSGRRVVVRLLPTGETEEVVVTLPQEAIEPPTEPPTRAGDWAPELHYDRLLGAALMRALALIHVGPVQVAPSAEISNSHEVDFLVRGPDWPVIVEAKKDHAGFRWRNALEQLLRHTRQFDSAGHARGLLVTDAAVGRHNPAAPDAFTRVVRWRNESDDEALAKALRELLEHQTPSRIQD